MPITIEEFKLLVDLAEKLFHFIARMLIFITIFRRYTQIEWVKALLLLWSFLEATALASQSQLHDLVHVDAVVEAAAALLNNPLHISSLGSNNSPGHLKLLFVLYLDVVSTGVFYALVLLVSSHI